MEFPNVNLDNFGDHVGKYEVKRFASVYDSIPFINIFPDAYPGFLFDVLNDNVNRIDTLDRLTKYTKNMDLSNQIEAGIYEFALLYSYKNDLNKEFISSVYNDKASEILANFDKKSSVNNKTLVNRLTSGEMVGQEIAFLSPQQLHPGNWKSEIEKKERVEYTKANRASTNMYKCNDCGERKCIVYQMQTRSSDEPMTQFCTCLVCYKTFKVG